MKKWIFSAALVLSTTLSISQPQIEQEVNHDHNLAPKMLSENDARFIEPSTVETQHLAVKGMEIKGFDAESLKKMQKAFEVVEKVVNTEEFKSRVINFVNTQGKTEFASNRGYSNVQIYDIFMDGRETLQPNTPNEMNFYLKLYYKRWSKVIGWTNGDINTININWKFFKGFKPSDVAGNLAHEWTHKLGFGHKSAKEHDSAPYAIGYIVREMGERYLKGEELH